MRNMKYVCPCCNHNDCYEEIGTPYIECGQCYFKTTKISWLLLTEKIDELKRLRGDDE